MNNFGEQIMIEERVHFSADTLRLEGVLTYHEDSAASAGILLCAPHPVLGGDMENNVITNIARASACAGFVSLRFNYRGVGNSESHEKDIAQRFHYWEECMKNKDYTDAITDSQAALDFLISQIAPNARICIAGYSFGAIVGMRIGVESNGAAAFASISTPFGVYPLDFLANCRKPKLFIYSQNDFATTVEDTLQAFSEAPTPKILELIEDSDHFYRGKEERISRDVCAFFVNQIKSN